MKKTTVISAKNVLCLLSAALLLSAAQISYAAGETAPAADTSAATSAAAAKDVRALSSRVQKDSAAGMQDFEKLLATRVAERDALLKRTAELRVSIERLRAKSEKLGKDYEVLRRQYDEQKDSWSVLDSTKRTVVSQMTERRQISALVGMRPFDAERIAKLRQSDYFPDIEDLRFLMKELAGEIEDSGAVSSVRQPVLASDGKSEESDVWRIGAVTAFAKVGGEWSYLIPNASHTALMTAPGTARGQDAALEAWTQGKAATLPLDISKGAVLLRPVQEKTLLAHLQAGGDLVWVILGIGFICLVFGALQLTNLARIRFPDAKTLTDILRQLRSGEFESAKSALEPMAGKRNPVAAVLMHMLTHGSHSVVGMEKCYEEAHDIYVMPLKKSTAMVAVGAAVAPLLGLLGTVTGMISTFDVITLFGNGDPKLLSGGISVALVTTEIGLVVAVVLMLLHYFMTRRFEVIEDRVEEYADIAIARSCAHFMNAPLAGVRDESFS